MILYTLGYIIDQYEQKLEIAKICSTNLHCITSWNNQVASLHSWQHWTNCNPYTSTTQISSSFWGNYDPLMMAMNCWNTFNGYKTNDSIRHELQTECILDKIDEYRRNWLLHLQRMPQNRIPLKSYHYSSQGKRKIGRPKKRWREQL
jgi:hypothetical protein